MEKILGILLFLLLIGGANILRWWIEKQQREKEAEERQHGAVPRPPSAAYPGRRPVFYGRPGENPPVAAPEAEPTNLQAPVFSLTDLEALESLPLQTAARRSARREPEPQPAPSPAPQAEPLKPPGTIKAAGPQATPFLGSLLKGTNAAKAIVLSEVLGPPKALQ